MRYAFDDFKSRPVGVEPQMHRNSILIKGQGGRDMVAINDAEQLKQVIALLKDAGELLNWKVPK